MLANPEADAVTVNCLPLPFFSPTVKALDSAGLAFAAIVTLEGVGPDWTSSEAASVTVTAVLPFVVAAPDEVRMLTFDENVGPLAVVVMAGHAPELPARDVDVNAKMLLALVAPLSDAGRRRSVYVPRMRRRVHRPLHRLH